jgi:2-polyprenyl-6-methoxyphenol hydroxylase-like FAD-dependent oxidoreductase
MNEINRGLALVVGGGIAGPVAAIALKRAGIESVVYEAHPSGAEPGAGAWLTVAVNGLDGLSTLGLHQAVMSRGFPTRSIRLRNASGSLLAEVPIGGRLADGTVTCTLKRADLYEIIAAEARSRGIGFVHGKKLCGADVGLRGRVVARFEGGSSETGDALIGADGIHSVTRRILDPEAPAPRYTGLWNVGGFTRAAGVDLEPGACDMYFGKRSFFGLTVSPTGEIWWFANPPNEHPLTRDRLLSTTADSWKAMLVELFADDETPAAEIVRSTTDPFVVTNQYDVPSVPRWRRGPMVLIGDAAHAAAPSSGQGVSMAIEDGIELARCLRDVPDIPAAFAAYERLRRERVERVVAHGARMSGFKTAGPIARRLRDLVLPWALRYLAKSGDSSMAWLYRHHIDWNARVDSGGGVAPAAPRSTYT